MFFLNRLFSGSFPRANPPVVKGRVCFKVLRLIYGLYIASIQLFVHLVHFLGQSGIAHNEVIQFARVGFNVEQTVLLFILVGSMTGRLRKVLSVAVHWDNGRCSGRLTASSQYGVDVRAVVADGGVLRQLPWGVVPHIKVPLSQLPLVSLYRPCLTAHIRQGCSSWSMWWMMCWRTDTELADTSSGHRLCPSMGPSAETFPPAAAYSVGSTSVRCISCLLTWGRTRWRALHISPVPLMPPAGAQTLSTNDVFNSQNAPPLCLTFPCSVLGTLQWIVGALAIVNVTASSISTSTAVVSAQVDDCVVQLTSFVQCLRKWCQGYSHRI